MADNEKASEEPSLWLLVVLLAFMVGAVGEWLVGTSWLSGPFDERWRGIVPAGLGVIGALGFLVGLVMPPDAQLLHVRRGGLDGGDLRVTFGNRALTLLVACVFAALAAGSTVGGKEETKPPGKPNVPAASAPASGS